MEKLIEHRKVWAAKKILREAYADWYRAIVEDLHDDGGPTIEIGGGSGNFKQYKRDIIATDIEPCPWLNICHDAHCMPFRSGTVSNLVMVDVLHHLADPIAFLEEARRVVKKGGRILMVEPYPSPFSVLVYRLFHPEPFLMDVDYFEERKTREKDPWDSNQAIPYLLFFKHQEKFVRRYGAVVSIVKRKRISFILYPASGGFSYNSYIPDFLIPLLKLAERLLKPFGWLLAFRCYIVLERKNREAVRG